jgi:small subunit ribosomal protein S8e
LGGKKLPQWHGDRNKKKISGGIKKSYRGKRSFEMGSEAAETELGSTVKKRTRRRGGITKIKLLSDEYINVTDPTTNKTVKTKIIRVLRNPVNVDYDRRKIITKSAIIETSLGDAVVTSHPGQDGLINAVLLPKS